MADRPYTVLSCAMSIDGYLDSAAGDRLMLSNEADLDRVDEVRAGCDALLVGAATIRRDDPGLVVRAPARRSQRVDRGVEPTPIKVTVTEHGLLDPSARFFADGQPLVYCSRAGLAFACHRLGRAATLIDGGTVVEMGWIAADLYARGIRRLMVEGGTRVLTQFLTAALADELDVVIAPFFVGDAGAPRVVGDGRFPWHASRRGTLAEVRRIDDVALLRYALSPRFEVEHA